jgi:hypothetical protein
MLLPKASFFSQLAFIHHDAVVPRIKPTTHSTPTSREQCPKTRLNTCKQENPNAPEKVERGA